MLGPKPMVRQSTSPAALPAYAARQPAGQTNRSLPPACRPARQQMKFWTGVFQTSARSKIALHSAAVLHVVRNATSHIFVIWVDVAACVLLLRRRAAVVFRCLLLLLLLLLFCWCRCCAFVSLLLFCCCRC